MPSTQGLVTRGSGIGAYYTPPAIVDFMCREALAAWLSGDGGIAPHAALDLVSGQGAAALAASEARWVRERLLGLRAIDPACGCGAFLEGLLRVIAQVWSAVSERLAPSVPDAGPVPETWLATHGLYGIELDPEAADTARCRVAAAMAGLGVAPRSARDGAWLAERITVGDALAVRTHASPVPCPVPGTEPEFDIVLVNPPYENMVAMEARSRARRQTLRETYATARGGFDLFVPFIERSLELLAPGGVLAALTPDKLLSAAYAATLRDRYRERVDLLAMADLTGARPFAAGVYPVVTIGRRRVDGRGDGPADVRIYGATGDGIRFAHEAPAGVLDRAGNRWAALFDPECDAITRAIAGLPRLAELAEVCGAATVAEAYAWQAAIVDSGRRLWQRDPERYAPFLVSGNIVPGAHTWGSRPVRYLGRSYREPVLDARHAAVSARRRRQILGGKVILSGLARRPTCVWDAGGLAAGKSTVLVIPRDGVRGEDLVAALNGDEAARIYRLLFGALSLTGGYLRFGPPQMRSLPVPSSPSLPVPSVRARPVPSQPSLPLSSPPRRAR